MQGPNADPATGEGFLASGAGDSTLSLAAGSVSLSLPASFRCVLTSDCGTATTAPADVSPGVVPTFVAEPQDASSCGTPVQFSVEATGAGAYRWAWLPPGAADWADVVEGGNYDPTTGLFAFQAAGAASATLSLDAVTPSESGPYGLTAFAGSACGEAMSNAAWLTTGAGMTFLEQPSGQTLCQGVTASFHAGVGDPSAAASWDMFNTDLQDWVPILEGWNEHPELGHFQAFGAGTFDLAMQGFADDRPPYDPKTGVMTVRCRVSGACGEATSDPADLAVVACCPADFNGDGFLDFFDYDDYVNCFESGECPSGKTADFNGDGFADFFDYDDFVAGFEAGC